MQLMYVTLSLLRYRDLIHIIMIKQGLCFLLHRLTQTARITGSELARNTPVVGRLMTHGDQESRYVSNNPQRYNEGSTQLF